MGYLASESQRWKCAISISLTNAESKDGEVMWHSLFKANPLLFPPSLLTARCESRKTHYLHSQNDELVENPQSSLDFLFSPWGGRTIE